MELFTWATPEATLKEEPRILTAKFGDGYGQDVPDGLNSILQQWDLVFSDIYPFEALAIRTFLKARKATEKFTWRSPLGETITVKCRKWSVSPSKKERLTITASFEQVP